MPTIRLATVAVLCGMVLGCGGSAPIATGIGPAHGGSVFTIPGGKGFVELATEAADLKATPPKRRLLIYFSRPDGSPLPSPPTDVSVKLLSGDSPVTVALKPDPADPSKFLSEPGPFEDEGRGEVAATIDGGAVQIPFTRR
jgi:hypothetical protein